MVKKSITFKTRNNRLQTFIVAIVIAIVAGVGVYFVSYSHAATSYVANTADKGTTAGITTTSACSGAKDGNCVTLGSNSTTCTSNCGSGINPAPSGPATPAGGWSVAMADDFNAPLGTGAGEDNLWYPNQNWSPAGSNAAGDQTYETESYNASQVSVSGGNLALTAKYDPNTNSLGANETYLSGMVTSPVGIQSGYKGFTWTPGGGETWAFEIDCQFPVDTNDLFNAFWSSTETNWTNEHDFFEGHDTTGQIDSDWIYDTAAYGTANFQDWYEGQLPFTPSSAMHRYTYVIYPDNTWSLFVDGVLQTWVGNNGVSPSHTTDTNPMQIIMNYALDGTSNTTTRSFLINSIAVYEDGDHAGQNISGGGLAPGTSIN